MKHRMIESYQDFKDHVFRNMIDPDVYVVDFIPEPRKNWRNKLNQDNFNHTRKSWFNLNKMINRHLLGRHAGRLSKRSLLLHSFNSFEIYDKSKKREWIKVVPHLHSVLFVHPQIKNKFKELLVVDSQEQEKDQIKYSGVRLPAPYTIRSEVFSTDNGIDLNDSFSSLEIRVPYDLGQKIDYALGLFEIWRPIHPENVFKDDLEEKQDGMDIFWLPSENDFKKNYEWML